MDAPTVIFEDETMLVVDKPAGMAVAARRGSAGLQSDCLLAWARGERSDGVINAHKLDDAISGLVVFGKDKAAVDFLSGEFQSKQAQRTYCGMVVLAAPGEEQERVTALPVLREADGGLPENFTVSYGLGPDQHVPGRMHVYRKRGGRPAETRVTVRETFGRYAWIEARPITNREMQVQAHLAAVGAPVLGDDAHGLPEVKLLLSGLKRGYKGRADERPLIDRLALHAERLTLRHPKSREDVHFEAPLPKAFEIALRNLRKFARR